MKNSRMRWGWQSLLGLLLLAGGIGCVDFDAEGEELCRQNPLQCAPFIEEGAQSAEQIPATGEVSFSVTAKDGSAEWLEFSWKANSGLLKGEKSTSTSSQANWVPSACPAAPRLETISVTVSNGHSQAIKNFSVRVEPCPYIRAPPIPRSSFVSPPPIASSGSHSLARRNDGSVWAWGSNAHGQLGVGMTENRSFASRVSQLTKVTALAAGDAHSLALSEDGRVWAWGLNGSGQLGNGGNKSESTPVLVSALADVISVAAGDAHSLALSANGVVWAWGSNKYGQLGNGSLDSFSSKPVEIEMGGLPQVVALAAGKSYSMVLCVDGSVWIWGLDISRTLPVAFTRIPTWVPGLTDVVALAAGRHHALALRVDGNVWSWGSNDFGQLGHGLPGFTFLPKPVDGLVRIRAITAGSDFSMALNQEGAIWAWGSNAFGQLGDGTQVNQDTPKRVLTSFDFPFLAAGERRGSAMGVDGAFWTWGDDGNGGRRPSPERVSFMN